MGVGRKNYYTNCARRDLTTLILFHSLFLFFYFLFESLGGGLNIFGDSFHLCLPPEYAPVTPPPIKLLWAPPYVFYHWLRIDGMYSESVSSTPVSSPGRNQGINRGIFLRGEQVAMAYSGGEGEGGALGGAQPLGCSNF